MRRGRRLLALAGVAVAGLAMATSLAIAQGVGFLTEQERLASYCAGVSEARMRELDVFLKSKCTGSDRKECRDSLDELERAQKMDRRLWGYLTGQIFTSKEHGAKEKLLSQTAMGERVTSVTSPYMKYNSRRGRRWVCAIVRPPGNCRESTAIT